MPVVAVYGAKQLANFDGISDGCMVRRSAWRKSTNEIRGDIMLGATRRNRIAKDTSADFRGAVRCVDDAFRFYRDPPT